MTSHLLAPFQPAPADPDQAARVARLQRIADAGRILRNHPDPAEARRRISEIAGRLIAERLPPHRNGRLDFEGANAETTPA